MVVSVEEGAAKENIEVVKLFENILLPHQILSDSSSLSFYGKDWRDDIPPNPSVVLLPFDALEVQKIMRLLSAKQIPVVPSGGRTGLSGGATASNGEVILSLAKFKSHLEIDEIGRTVTCDAGMVTENLMAAVAKKDLYLPIEFASQGSSQIGGNIATNIGGMRVIKFGNIRQYVLGLKVVLADGTLLNLNGSLVKNQCGYDLRQLFIGSEGTLGVIVEVTLQLLPLKLLTSFEKSLMLCALTEIKFLSECIIRIREKFPEIHLLEFFDDNSLEVVLKHKNLPPPFKEKAPGYLLIEVSESVDKEEILQELLELGLLTDIVVATSKKQYRELMTYREEISQTLSSHYILHKNDISVPIKNLQPFLQALYSFLHGTPLSTSIFGHLGDGNLHLNFFTSLNNSSLLQENKEKLDEGVYQLVRKYQGSIAAEHGVGLLKRDFIQYTVSSEEVSLMQGIKRVFDPLGILNPGKIFTS
jgi:FAD/FMN-containing dehydrogenase